MGEVRQSVWGKSWGWQRTLRLKQSLNYIPSTPLFQRFQIWRNRIDLSSVSESKLSIAIRRLHISWLSVQNCKHWRGKLRAAVPILLSENCGICRLLVQPCINTLNSTSRRSWLVGYVRLGLVQNPAWETMAWEVAVLKENVLASWLATNVSVY